MPRRLRFVPPEGSIVEVTTRTLQGRLLLRPSLKLNLIILGVLGRAQRLYRVRIHDFVFMSNHYHLLVSVDSALQLARFMGYFNGNLAKEVARLTGWRDKIWSRRYQAALVSNEAAAQIARLRYILRHGVKEGLVASPRAWPGVASLKARLTDATLEGLWFDRTKEFTITRQSGKLVSREVTEKETVHLTPLPCLQELSPTRMRAFVEEMVKEIEQEATGTRFLGTDEILRQPPTAKPQQSKRSPAPFAHCASRQERRLLWTAYYWFLASFLDAKERLRAGRQAIFPEGAFPPPAPFVGIALEPG